MASNPSYSSTHFIRPEFSTPQSLPFTAHDHDHDHDHDNSNSNSNNNLGSSSKYATSRTSRRTRNPSQCNRCAQCNRVYARSDHLVRHLRSHSEQNLYVCSVCGKSFARKCIHHLPYKSKSLNVALLTSLGTSSIVILLCIVAPVMPLPMAINIFLCLSAGPPRLVPRVQ
jgi:uncharacterized Zn-finger protein